VLREGGKIAIELIVFGEGYRKKENIPKTGVTDRLKKEDMRGSRLSCRLLKKKGHWGSGFSKGRQSTSREGGELQLKGEGKILGKRRISKPALQRREKSQG